MPTVTDTNRYGISVSVGAAGGNGINATWFGDGSDGKIEVTSGNTYTVSVVEDAQTAVINAQSLKLDEGATITTSGRCQGLIIKVQKDCVINGTINMNCKSPLQCVNEEELAANPVITLCGSPAGGNGGAGGNSHTSNFGNTSTPAYGGAGGSGHVFGGGYGGGGAGGAGGGGSSATRPAVGITWPYPGASGSNAGAYGSGGGGGAGTGGSAPGGSGGAQSAYYEDGSGSTSAVNGNNGNSYGGGAIYLIVGGNLTIGSTGVLTANGGNGGNSVAGTHTSIDHSDNTAYSSSTTTGSGGGGGGGVICVVYRGTIVHGGTLSVAGGTAGTSSNSACVGANGSVGTTKVASFDSLMEVS